MRTFDVSVVDGGIARPVRYARPLVTPRPNDFHRYHVVYNDNEGEGWRVFIEADSFVNARLIADALNAPGMKKKVEKAAERTQQAAPIKPTTEDRLGQLEDRMSSYEGG